MSSCTAPPNSGATSCGYTHHLDVLRDVSFFTGVSLDALKVLAYFSIKETFNEGEILVSQGEVLEQFCFIHEGDIAVIREVEGEPLVVHHLRDNDFYGGMSLVSSAKSLFTLKVLSPATCLVIEREKFQKTVQRFPDILPNILEAVVNHVYKWEDKMLRETSKELLDSEMNVGLTLY